MIARFATAAALAFTATAATAATPATEARTVAVRTADLDLSKPAGVQTLKHRVAMAVEAVCGSYAGVETPEIDHVTRCRREAMASLPVRVAALIDGHTTQLAAR
jgi:UrcA family protein